MFTGVSKTLRAMAGWFSGVSLGLLLFGGFVTLAVVDERKPQGAPIAAKPVPAAAVPVHIFPAIAANPAVKAVAVQPNPGRLADFANWPAGEPLEAVEEHPGLIDAAVSADELASSQPGQPRSGSPNILSLKTYRTVCVRTCDGFFWQISFAAPRTAFGIDSNICKASCGGETKLYAFETGYGGGPESMIDADGEPYSKLPNAFRYRKEYMPACGCQPKPWEQAALARQAEFARLEQAGTLEETLAANDLARRAKLKEGQAQVLALSGGEASVPGKKRKLRKALVSTRTVIAGNSSIQVIGLNGKPISGLFGLLTPGPPKILHGHEIFQLYNGQR